MSRIAYVNGQYIPHANAGVHIEDRGYQFADGVYEVCEVARGNIMDMTRHLNRLDRSLSELRIGWPMNRKALQSVIAEVVRRNRVYNGMVYLQVTRGVAKRDHVFPAADTPPSIVITAKRTDPVMFAARAAKGVKVITVPENRWDRVDIKSIGLLPNVMALPNPSVPPWKPCCLPPRATITSSRSCVRHSTRAAWCSATAISTPAGFIRGSPAISMPV